MALEAQVQTHVDEPRGFARFSSVTWRGFRRYPVLPLAVLVILIVFAIFAPLLAPHDPKQGDLRDRNIPPIFMDGGSSDHVLGTDLQGRDILSRVIFGARISMIIATTVVLAGGVGGTLIGIVAGYRGGWLDELAMRTVDFTLALPFLLVALVVVIVLGQSLTLMIVLLILFGWDSYARQVRAEVLTLRDAEYVQIAQIQGASLVRIIFRHILPNLWGIILVVSSLRVGGLILTESTLSFLGVGVPPSTPAWGIMVADGRAYLDTAWWVSFMPGVAIFLVVMSFNFLGDWLRDYFDPRLRQL